jgi:phenazine biosynthesis protein phzE
MPGEVHALRGPHFTSVQFHAESVLTRDGERIIGDLLVEAMNL